MSDKSLFQHMIASNLSTGQGTHTMHTDHPPHFARSYVNPLLTQPANDKANSSLTQYKPLVPNVFAGDE